MFQHRQKKKSLIVSLAFISFVSMLSLPRPSALYQKIIGQGELRVENFLSTDNQVTTLMFYSSDHQSVYLTQSQLSGAFRHCELNADGSFHSILTCNLFSPTAGCPSLIIASDTATCYREVVDTFFIEKMNKSFKGQVITLPRLSPECQWVQTKIDEFINSYRLDRPPIEDDQGEPEDENQFFFQQAHQLGTPVPSCFIYPAAPQTWPAILPYQL